MHIKTDLIGNTNQPSKKLSLEDSPVVGLSTTQKDIRFMKREPTYFHMDSALKDAMRQITDYKHATLSNLIEEGARLLVSNESLKIQKEMNQMNTIRDMMRM